MNGWLTVNKHLQGFLRLKYKGRNYTLHHLALMRCWTLCTKTLLSLCEGYVQSYCSRGVAFQLLWSQMDQSSAHGIALTILGVNNQAERRSLPRHGGLQLTAAGAQQKSEQGQESVGWLVASFHGCTSRREQRRSASTKRDS